MEEKLKKYGLKVHWNESDNPDKEPIDFSIEDDEDNVAWVWGSEPFNDVQFECNHPYECTEFGDETEQGECLLCGATCDWHYEEEWEDDGHDDEGNCVGHKVQEPVITEWYHPKKIGGMIGDYLKELQERW